MSDSTTIRKIPLLAANTAIRLNRIYGDPSPKYGSRSLTESHANSFIDLYGPEMSLSPTDIGGHSSLTDARKTANMSLILRNEVFGRMNPTEPTPRIPPSISFRNTNQAS
ncbi:MAG: hypothetical protein AAF212_07430 [Verrucomicrobiota bacterium]